MPEEFVVRVWASMKHLPMDPTTAAEACEMVWLRLLERSEDEAGGQLDDRSMSAWLGETVSREALRAQRLHEWRLQQAMVAVPDAQRRRRGRAR